VARAKDRMKGKSVVSATTGELRITRDSLKFTPTRNAEGAAGPYSPAELKSCGLNSSYGKDSHTFHIKTAHETLDLRPLHFSKDEADLVCSLAAKYLKVNPDK
jgi:hypothetical protein